MIKQVQETQKPTESKEQLFWSPRLKHHDISIYGNVSKRIDMTNGGYSTCIVANKFLSQNQSSYQWTLKVNQRQGALFIGVCLLSFLEKDNFSYEGLGNKDHGHYVLESDGNVFLHSGERIGRNEVEYTIKAGDIVQLLYLRNQLKFTKNNVDLFTMNILPFGKSDKLCPIIYLGRTDDSVQIIS